VKLPWWLYAILAVAGVLLGIKFRHERELEQARKRAEEWRRRAYENRNAQAVAESEAAIARIDRDLADARGRNILDRVRAAVEDARRRRESGAS